MGTKTQVVQTPYQNTTQNTYGYQTMPGVDASKAVADFQSVNTNPDPGAAGRTDLSQMANQNKWDNTFTQGLPYYLRQRIQDSEARQIGLQGNLEQQQAEYMANAQKMSQKGALLPQLVQTGGSSSGYNSQAFQSPSVLGQVLQGAAGLIKPFSI